MLGRPVAAIRRCARHSAAIFLTYVVSAAVGAAMVHGGNRFALARRDAMVARAVAEDRASIDYRAGRRVRAALADAAANFGLAALPQTVLGLTVVLPFGTVALQGWAGGLVSVDGHHESRLRTARGACYYLGVLTLQFLAFSLCIGAGERARRWVAGGQRTEVHCRSIASSVRRLRARGDLSLHGAAPCPGSSH